MHPLERVGGGPRDQLAGRDVAGERHHRDVGVRHERVAGGLALAGHDVEHAGREDVGGDLGESQRAERRELRRLEHDGVAGRERGADLPGRHVERVVPRRDRGDDAERVAPQERRVLLHVLAGGPALEEPRAPPAKNRQLSSVRSISNSMIDSGLPTLSISSVWIVVEVGLDGVGDLVQRSRCARAGSCAAHSSKRRRGAATAASTSTASLDGNLVEHLAGRRVHDLVGRAALGVDPLAADEVLLRHRDALARSTWPRSPRCCVPSWLPAQGNPSRIAQIYDGIPCVMRSFGVSCVRGSHGRRATRVEASAPTRLTTTSSSGSSTSRKRFGDFVAVDDADFAIQRGEFFSMLGPSGCGKTTTLRMIAGFEQPTVGRDHARGQRRLAASRPTSATSTRSSSTTRSSRT